MKQLVLGLLLLLSSVAAWAGAPCCNVVSVDARAGIVTIMDVKTGAVSRYKAEPVGIKGLKVGAQVDLAGGQLRTATGLVIRGQVQP